MVLEVTLWQAFESASPFSLHGEALKTECTLKPYSCHFLVFPLQTTSVNMHLYFSVGQAQNNSFSTLSDHKKNNNLCVQCFLQRGLDWSGTLPKDQRDFCCFSTF